MCTQLAMLAMFLITLTSLAQRPATDPAKVIAPFVDENTLAVARVDAARLDLPPIMDQITALGLMEADKRNALQQQLTKAREQFLKAGGRDIYLLVHLADLPAHPFTVVVPLNDGADAAALMTVLRQTVPINELAVDTIGK